MSSFETASTMDSNQQKEAEETSADAEARAESLCNLALLDASKWGWTALGGVCDILPPHQRARRRSTRSAILKEKRKREKNRASVSSGNSLGGGGSSSPHPKTEDTEKSADGESLTQQATFLGDPMSKTEDENGINKDSLTQQNRQDQGIERCSTDAVKFRALTSDGRLDISMYHRGREGMELRDEITADLLCDVEPTDTNHNLDAPRLKANIMVQFPLEDGDNPRYYRENMQWDLGSPQTPSPMEFALNVSQTYGLKFSQTMELAESIQRQLRAFVSDSCAYAPPLSVLSEAGRPQTIVPSLYGEVTGEPEGGHWYAASQKTSRTLSRTLSGSVSRPSAADRHGSTARSGSTTRSRSIAKSGSKRKRDSLSESNLPIEPVYRAEVKKRLRVASVNEVREKWESFGKTTVVGALASRTDSCHICQKEGSCGIFPCGRDGHCYCYNHLDEFFESVNKEDKTANPLGVTFCPVCALSCTCSDCENKLEVLAKHLKRESMKQDVDPEHTSCEDLLSRSRERVRKNAKKKTGRWGYRRELSERPVVPKVPASDFPREVFNGVDIDPGNDTIYATVYKKHGSYVDQNPFPSVSEQRPDVAAVEATHAPEAAIPTAASRVATSPAVEGTSGNYTKVSEDGSVDYCVVCRQVGNLICCDYCPRAFHRACIPGDDPTIDESDQLWECPSCKREKAGLEKDKLDGTEFRDKIFTAFDGLGRALAEADLQALETISILYEMILTLIDYDFGYMFRSPVDLSQIPTYTQHVKHPMDLGTISENIINGKYKDDCCNGGKPIEEAVLAILKDIELVWHNCFIFNFEGSAVYRMAEVQRRRVENIRKQSFESLLSERVKEKLKEYVDECSRLRGGAKRTAVPLVVPRVQQSNRPQARHKITAHSVGTSGRPIAVYDPETGRVVKMYAITVSVLAVADLFFNLKHPCEYNRDEIASPGKIRRLIVQSCQDPSVRFFGYRWVFFDDLERGRIAFGEDKQPQKSGIQKEHGDISEQSFQIQSDLPKIQQKYAVEMCIGDHSFLFESIELALAYGSFSSSDAAVVRSGVSSMSSGDDYAEFAGKKWRKVSLPSADARTSGKCSISQLPDVAVAKKDTLCGRTIVAFRTVNAAYHDWIKSLDASLYPVECPTSVEYFCEAFLDGDQNLDGLEWHRISKNNDDTNSQESTIGVQPMKNDTPVVNGVNKLSLHTPQPTFGDGRIVTTHGDV